MSTSNLKEQEGWSSLPNDLLQMIMSKLFFVDQLNFRAVCKSWSSMDEVLPAETRLPWLMILGWTTSKLIDTTYRKTYSIDMRHPRQMMNIRNNLNTMKVHASKHGWLLISSSCSSQIFMWTPLYDQNNLIELPALDQDKFSHATFTSSPYMNRRCEFIALKVNSDSNTLIINTYLLGDDSWKTFSLECHAFSISTAKHWMYSEGILYFSTGFRKIRTFDIARKKLSLLPQIPYYGYTYKFAIFDVALQELVSISAPTDFLLSNNCLVDTVKCNGELFVILGRNWTDDQRLCFGGKIFKLNPAQNTWDDSDHPDLDYLFMRRTGELGGAHLDLNTDWEDMEGSFSPKFIETTTKPCHYEEQMKDSCKGLPHIEVRSYVNNWYAALAAHRSLRRLWIDRLISCSNCSSSYLG